MQNTSVELFAKPANNVKDVQKKISDNATFRFKDTLDLAVEKTSYKPDDNKHNYLKNNDREFERKSNFKSHERHNYQNNPTKDTLKSSNKEVNKVACDEFDDEVDIRKKAVNESLAQILGIGIEQLTTMIEFLNVNLEEPLTTSQLVSEISGFLELDSNEENVLLNILQIVEEKVADAFKEDSESVKPFDVLPDKDNLVGPQNILLEEIEDVGVSFKEEKSLPFKEELSLSIRGKLRQLSENEHENLSKEILENVDQVMVGKITKDEIALPENKDVLSVNLNDTTKGKLESNLSLENESKEEDKSEEDTSEDVMKNTFAQKNETTESLQNETYVETFGDISKVNSYNQHKIKELAKDERPLNIDKKEITSQIVEKAKVLLDGDKSEMVIDLKPDHLGKMALKVVTERGLVIAKFTTENEQVKAAIEANMDTLKESLERQGFSIQGFSVSVGQNKNRNTNSNNESHSGFGNKSTKENQRIMVNLKGDINSIHNNLNPYIVGESSINLTA